MRSGGLDEVEEALLGREEIEGDLDLGYPLPLTLTSSLLILVFDLATAPSPPPNPCSEATLSGILL